MIATLEEKNMTNWKKMTEYMALYYPTPHFGSFGSGFSTSIFIYVTMYL
jgi:hypothetical protein